MSWGDLLPGELTTERWVTRRLLAMVPTDTWPPAPRRTPAPPAQTPIVLTAPAHALLHLIPTEHSNHHIPNEPHVAPPVYGWHTSATSTARDDMPTATAVSRALSTAPAPDNAPPTHAPHLSVIGALRHQHGPSTNWSTVLDEHAWDPRSHADVGRAAWSPPRMAAALDSEDWLRVDAPTTYWPLVDLAIAVAHLPGHPLLPCTPAHALLRALAPPAPRSTGQDTRSAWAKAYEACLLPWPLDTPQDMPPILPPHPLTDAEHTSTAPSPCAAVCSVLNHILPHPMSTTWRTRSDRVRTLIRRRLAFTDPQAPPTTQLHSHIHSTVLRLGGPCLIPTVARTLSAVLRVCISVEAVRQCALAQDSRASPVQTGGDTPEERLCMTDTHILCAPPAARTECTHHPDPADTPAGATPACDNEQLDGRPHAPGAPVSTDDMTTVHPPPSPPDAYTEHGRCPDHGSDDEVQYAGTNKDARGLPRTPTAPVPTCPICHKARALCHCARRAHAKGAPAAGHTWPVQAGGGGRRGGDRGAAAATRRGTHTAG